MEHRRKEKSEYVVQSVDRALDILEAFNYSEEELGVTELSHKLNLHKNNVFRLLATLETRGYIEQDKKTGNYRLGIKIFEVANVFLHHLGLRRQARPILEELVGKCNETAYLAVTDGPEVVYILMQETSHAVRVASRMGQRLPAYCTGNDIEQHVEFVDERLAGVEMMHLLALIDFGRQFLRDEGAHRGQRHRFVGFQLVDDALDEVGQFRADAAGNIDWIADHVLSSCWMVQKNKDQFA